MIKLSNSIIQNVKPTAQDGTIITVSFNILSGNATYNITLQDGFAQLKDMRNGKCICATFLNENERIELWKRPANKYRLMRDSTTNHPIDIVLDAKEMDKIFMYFI